MLRKLLHAIGLLYDPDTDARPDVQFVGQTVRQKPVPIVQMNDDVVLSRNGSIVYVKDKAEAGEYEFSYNIGTGKERTTDKHKEYEQACKVSGVRYSTFLKVLPAYQAGMTQEETRKHLNNEVGVRTIQKCWAILRPPTEEVKEVPQKTRSFVKLRKVDLKIN